MKNNKPIHVGIIMDGNGRWAKNNNLYRSKGHEKGLENIKNVCEFAIKSKIKFLTLFSLSAENLSRPKEEIFFLVNLIDYAIDYYKDFIFENKIIFNFFGEVSILKDETICKIEDIKKQTNKEFSKSNSLVLNIAFNYGGKQEIILAINKLFLNLMKLKKFNNENFKIKENDLKKHFYLPDLPDPDLIIRTGSYQRLSNFLLWQSAYSELYFSSKLWPDFSNLDFENAINFFQSQKRNFGLINNN